MATRLENSSGNDYEPIRYARAHVINWLDTLNNDTDLPHIHYATRTLLSQLMPTAEITMELSVEGELALDQPWTTHLIQIYKASGGTDIHARMRTLSAIIYYCLDSGLPHHASMGLHKLMQALDTAPDGTTLDAALASLMLTGAEGYNDVDRYQMLISCADAANDFRAMGQLYAGLAFWFVNRAMPEAAFESAQMAYAIGIQVGDAALAAMGLHHMASTFQISKDADRMGYYLDLTFAFLKDKNLPRRMNYVEYTLGVRLMLHKRFREAEMQFRQCCEIFQPEGTRPYIQSRYMVAHAVMEQARFSEARELFYEVLEQNSALELDFDQLYTTHSLAELAWREGDTRRALQLIRSVIAHIQGFDDQRRQPMEAELFNDLRKYAALPTTVNL
jgi:hypothetical protein